MLNYAAEKLSYAVRALATGKGRIRERLTAAAELAEVVGASGGNPADFKERYDALMRRLRSALGTELSEDDDSKLAGEILALADEAEERAKAEERA